LVTIEWDKTGKPPRRQQNNVLMSCPIGPDHKEQRTRDDLIACMGDAAGRGPSFINQQTIVYREFASAVLRANENCFDCIQEISLNKIKLASSDLWGHTQLLLVKILTRSLYIYI